MSSHALYWFEIDTDEDSRELLLADLLMFDNEVPDNLDSDGYQKEDYHWEYEDIFKRFSAKHPGVLFKMYGEAEGNHWVDYFKNGKQQTESGEIVYGEFDPEKLE